MPPPNKCWHRRVQDMHRRAAETCLASLGHLVWRRRIFAGAATRATARPQFMTHADPSPSMCIDV
eukprot:CAMPEP_0179223938 /NCGR_PEP_ID=MMETSP0797-20121207/7515_1 /TAXON_ID=47934 /ORGANISM="Dinophysis acuminata, Strain DAEP01" /LENGTH=64 /DNA_ID=CAMNT_0020930869 /DNA_START=41 /DNA_END=232 /DNA_ORIENTATION=-